MKKSRSSKQDKPADKEHSFVFMNDDGSITVNSPAAIKHLGQAYFDRLVAELDKMGENDDIDTVIDNFLAKENAKKQPAKQD